jgi:hypothetical protein
MNRHEQQRIIDFLRKKQCTPCRNGSLDHGHSGCVEAEELIDIITSEVPEN